MNRVEFQKQIEILRNAIKDFKIMNDNIGNAIDIKIDKEGALKEIKQWNELEHDINVIKGKISNMFSIFGYNKINEEIDLILLVDNFPIYKEDVIKEFYEREKILYRRKCAMDNSISLLTQIGGMISTMTEKEFRLKRKSSLIDSGESHSGKWFWWVMGVLGSIVAGYILFILGAN